jgi:hypothetical protein
VGDLLGRHGRRASESLAARPGGVQALMGALHDEFPDEFGQRGEHVENEAAARRGGVDRFLQGTEPDSLLPEARDDADEVLE